MKLQFCPYTDKDFDVIREVLETVFMVSDYSRIKGVYSEFQQNFYGKELPKLQTISKEAVKPHSDREFSRKFLDDQFLPGIDLPSLLCPETRGEATVFLVGEDPLRKEKLRQQISGQVILSTPFGTHLPKERTGRLRVYWGLIEYLIEHGSNVYLTDVFKLWLKGVGNNKEHFTKETIHLFYAALQKEVAYFNPSIIVSFGNTARELVEPLKTDAKKINFTHPAATANGKWKKILEEWGWNEGCSASGKVEYMAKKIEESLIT
jgi:hypothetical protein